MDSGQIPEWITLEQAEKLLGGTPADLPRLIRMRRLTHRESDNTVRLDDVITILELREFDSVLDAGGSEKEARRRAESLGARLNLQFSISNFQLSIPNPAPASVPSVSSVVGNPKSSVRFDGLEWLSVKQTAELLRLSVDHIYHLLQTRLNSEKRDGRRWILKEDVESYARLQRVWDEAAGEWTPYGRLAKAEGARRALQAIGSPAQMPSARSVSAATGVDLQNDSWIRPRTCTEILNVSYKHFLHIAKARGFKRAKGASPGSVSLHHPSGQGLPSWFLLSEVLAYRDEQDRKRRTISPAEWNRDLRHPVIRTELIPPPGDELIPVKEAARILDVSPPNVSNLVSEGKLFGWQEEPGKPGCRLWLSLNQVCRYSQNPQRLKARKAWDRRGPEWGENWDEWEEMGIQEYSRRRPSRSTKRDRGEFFTTRQAALVLRISPTTVLELRARGRLKGYRKPSPRGRVASKLAWWFFKKDDVYNLLADPAYRRKRKQQSGRAPDMGRLE